MPQADGVGYVSVRLELEKRAWRSFMRVGRGVCARNNQDYANPPLHIVNEVDSCATMKCICHGTCRSLGPPPLCARCVPTLPGLLV